MIYTLPLQSDELLQPAYFKLRKLVNPTIDIIHLTVKNSHNLDLNNNQIYKKILHLDGRYRTLTNSWLSPKVNIRVINQL